MPGDEVTFDRGGLMPGRSNANLADVAARAGVGSATVDRVLNERGNVSPETAWRVVEAARALGLRRILPQSYRGLLRIEAILPRPELPLIDRLLRFLRARRQRFGRSVVLLRKILPDEAVAHEQDLERVCQHTRKKHLVTVNYR